MKYPMRHQQSRLLSALAFIALITLFAAGCGTEPPTEDSDGPCPCEEDAECGEDSGLEVCISSIEGQCFGDEYICDDGLYCQNAICRGDEGFDCEEPSDCRDGLQCITGVCATENDIDPCPCDGDAECVETDDGERCIAPRGEDCGEAGYDCGEDLLCEDDVCTGGAGAGCDDDGDCGEGLQCVDDECQMEDVSGEECQAEEDCPDGYTCDLDTNECELDGPCPCDGDAECGDDDGTPVCVAPLGESCKDEDYVCGDDLSCDDGTCRGEQWQPCQEADDCAGDLGCAAGYCDEDHCNGTSCPDDGDSSTVAQIFCDAESSGCVQCRYWADQQIADDDCPDEQVCTTLGYCADPIPVPRAEPFDDDLPEAEAVAIATAVCSLETDDHKAGGGSTANYLCGTIVTDGADQILSENDVRGPAQNGDFHYLSAEGVIDGYNGGTVADEIETVWEEPTIGIERLSWFSESSTNHIEPGDDYEYCVWMGSSLQWGWRIGIDTCQAYMDRGYVDDWNEDG